MSIEPPTDPPEYRCGCCGSVDGFGEGGCECPSAWDDDEWLAKQSGKIHLELESSIHNNDFLLSIRLNDLTPEQKKKLFKRDVISPRNNWATVEHPFKDDAVFYIQFKTKEQGILFIARAEEALNGEE